MSIRLAKDGLWVSQTECHAIRMLMEGENRMNNAFFAGVRFAGHQRNEGESTAHSLMVLL